jgi:hypothetical protein
MQKRIIALRKRPAMLRCQIKQRNKTDPKEPYTLSFNELVISRMSCFDESDYEDERPEERTGKINFKDFKDCKK